MGNKNKHSFWSQLLLSMLAIFLLPTTQDVSIQTTSQESNYQHTQQVEQIQVDTVLAASLSFAQPQQLTWNEVQIYPQIQPHFALNRFVAQIPIRAGP